MCFDEEMFARLKPRMKRHAVLPRSAIGRAVPVSYSPEASTSPRPLLQQRQVPDRRLSEVTKQDRARRPRVSVDLPTVQSCSDNVG